MTTYFNEHDPYAAQWLRNLYPRATVDERSIHDVSAADVVGFERVHFFGGIGGWQFALDLAGWPGPVWTGSCPCQPFSAAGKRKGEADERHLWPEFFRLIRECRPATVFGEQVASKDGLRWLDGVFADLEGAGYVCGAADLCAAGAGEEAEGRILRGSEIHYERIIVGAPHIRQRLFWVAIIDEKRLPANTERELHDGKHHAQPCSGANGVGYDGGKRLARRTGKPGNDGQKQPATQRASSDAGRLSDSAGSQRRDQGPQVPRQRGEQSVTESVTEHGGGLGDTNGARHKRTGRRGRAGAVEGIGAPAVDPCRASSADGLEHSEGHGRDERRPQPGWRSTAGRCGDGAGLGGLGQSEDTERGQGVGDDSSRQRQTEIEPGNANPWHAFHLVPCRDNKTRRVGSSVQPLAARIPRDLGREKPELRSLAKNARSNRVGRLRGYGNAIVPHVAAMFIRAVMETL